MSRTINLRYRSVLVTLVAAIPLFTQSSTFATDFVRFVDDSASAGGDGVAWSTAYRVLQDALAEAVVLTSGIGNSDTVTIRVAAGTYYPDRFNDSTTGTGSRSAAF